MSIETTRRKFIIGASVASAEAVVRAVIPKVVLARPDEPDLSSPEDISLQKYLKTIEAEKISLKQVVDNRFLFDGFKDFSLEQQRKGFGMYFPMYKATEIKYGVP